ncbi:MAG: hypothetical protein J6S53_09975 [Lentisphaeria bacterium]|nr:hypothetical protein [Lentisphaeria bacterium]
MERLQKALSHLLGSDSVALTGEITAELKAYPELKAALLIDRWFSRGCSIKKKYKLKMQ